MDLAAADHTATYEEIVVDYRSRTASSRVGSDLFSRTTTFEDLRSANTSVSQSRSVDVLGPTSLASSSVRSRTPDVSRSSQEILKPLNDSGPVIKDGHARRIGAQRIKLLAMQYVQNSALPEIAARTAILDAKLGQVLPRVNPLVTAALAADLTLANEILSDVDGILATL